MQWRSVHLRQGLRQSGQHLCSGFATGSGLFQLRLDSLTGPLLSEGGVGGIAFNGSRLAVTDAQDVVWALDATSGAPMWKQPSYPRRALTAPAIIGNHVVAGDYDGYLHWFSLDDVMVARCPVAPLILVAAAQSAASAQEMSVAL